MTAMGRLVNGGFIMAEKRAAASLDELRAAVERDFSKNVVVSHGLFRSPYPFGAHLFCEVDTATLDRKKWGDSKMELVLRVIALPPGDSAPLAAFSKFLKVLHRDATLEDASFEALVLALEKTRFFSSGLKDLSRSNSAVEEREGDGDYQQRLLQLCLGSSHPCIAPLTGAFLGNETLYLVFPPAPYTLRSLLHFSPGALGDDWQLRFFLYQIIAGLAHCHKLEVFHGNITPSSVLITSSMWCWLTGFATTSIRREVFNPTTETSLVEDELEWRSQFKKWFRGELSNFDYLLLLNRLAGRRWGDRCFHTVMPWVIDFTAKPDQENDTGWRDLTKSKWRLAKGDEQLDFTYATAEIPHHVSDECLSELAVCIYKARRLPLLVLRRVVRSVYEPNEYPVNMQRLYHWTPDECIPEFYSDPEVFRSIHHGMGDLAVPSWAEDPEDFIRLHRSALESDRVSRQLHEWIDLTFGYKLSGEAAVLAKNVTLSTTAPSMPRSSGRRQLFSKPHPMRMTSSSKKNLLEQLEESASFCSSGRSLSPWYGVPVPDPDGHNSTNSDHPPVASNACEAILRNVAESDEKLWGELFQKLHFEQDDDVDDENVSYQRLVAWQREVSVLRPIRESEAADIFGIGCLVAEIFLQKPLFDSTSAAVWLERKSLPGTLNQLPPHVRIVVETTLAADIKRRPSAEKLLESPFFPPVVRSAYTFLSSFHFLASNHDRLFYAAKMAQQSAFALMGPVASELCAPACLSVIAHPYNDLDPMAVIILLKSLLQVLKQQASRRLLLPVVQSILQENDADAQLKAGLLGSSFIRNLRRLLGTHVYLQHFHSLIVLSVLRSPESQQASAASLVLVETCQELGLPVTLNQTIRPLLQSLGRDITVHGVDSLVEIGEKFGPEAIIKHWLPPLNG
ncbi:protein GFS12 [Selaginella moellendorffii]|uniref:protein GFS12 n=1 Tax=Selaginella moellendorffii TaxID=88036 RepID=UPI000D1C8369|nr:protein GFS12 [Selaginella moellendorffii]|eukprot:XP_002990350.2 protein GFS12 [Selaginella moellendorffii]